MKHFTNLRWLIMSLLLAVSVGSAWGDEVTIDLTSSDNYSSQGTSGTGSNVSASSGGINFGSDKGYLDPGNHLRIYMGGKITVSTSNGLITKIAITCTSSGTSNNGPSKISSTVTSGGGKYTYSGNVGTWENSSGSNSITLSASAQVRMTQVVITYTSSSSTQTVATPTFSPAEGAVEAGTSVSINCETDDATIYYTTDGTDPSSKSNVYSSAITINETKTIKAFATKTGFDDSEIASATYTVESDVPGYVIDFESSLTRYTDWTFTGIGNTNTAITANGGSKYGANINDSGNGVGTASIQTKDKVANPGTFTCYVSKVSTNTSSSTWYIQVSSDGENWTNVATQSATSMTKGVWVEFTANLSSHKNVYVRLYYNGSTAIRAVDDIELTESTSTDPIDPSINVNDAKIEYGKTFTVNASDIQGGAITVTSGNEQIATVDGLVITSVAVGQVVITVSTAETAVYNAGSATFTLTVTAPVGQSTKQTAEPEAIFNETFAECESTGGNGTDGFATASNSEIGSEDYDNSTDNTGWTLTKGYPANACIKFGGSKAQGSATTPSITVENGKTYTLTFKAAPWSSEADKTMTVEVTGGTINDEASVTTSSMTSGEWNEFTYDIVATGTNMILNFSCSANRFFLDEVKITKPGVVVNPTVTTAASGYASYCCEYPIDLDELDSSVKAYAVSANSSTSATFTQLTGTIKGGVPFILKGDANTEYELTLADESTTVPSSNMLRGTLAPTYVTTEEGAYTNLGLSGGEFKRIKPGTIKKNKAYLQVPTSSLSESVKSFSITFEDATGIDHTEVMPIVDNEAWFDLSGRRVTHPTKGLYIHGGKKVFVK